MPHGIFPPYNERYVRATPWSAEKECFLRIYGAGVVYPDSRYEFDKTMDVYLFEYIVSGKGYIEADGKKRIVSQGDCTAIVKGKHIHYGADKKDPYVKLWFSVSGDFVKALFGACLPENPEIVIKKINCYTLFEKMLAYLESNDKDDVKELSSIILEILLALAEKIQPPAMTDEPIAGQIKQFIDNFIFYDVTIKRASEHLGITERSAKKIFTDEYGISPGKYIREKKLEYALELLEHSTKTVSDIAGFLGFCDQSYFSTVFKNVYGVYPSEYREKKRDEKRKEKGLS